MKSSSAVWVQREFRLPHFQWQEGYGGFTVSPSRIKSVRAYIANQEQHHRRKTFQEEYLQLLDDGGIEYDKRYLW
jgi:putative transposase